MVIQLKFATMGRHCEQQHIRHPRVLTGVANDPQSNCAPALAGCRNDGSSVDVAKEHDVLLVKLVCIQICRLLIHSMPVAGQTQHCAMPDAAPDAVKAEPATGCDIAALHQGAEVARTMLALSVQHMAMRLVAEVQTATVGRGGEADGTMVTA